MSWAKINKLKIGDVISFTASYNSLCGGLKIWHDQGTTRWTGIVFYSNFYKKLGVSTDGITFMFLKDLKRVKYLGNVELDRLEKYYSLYKDLTNIKL